MPMHASFKALNGPVACCHVAPKGKTIHHREHRGHREEMNASVLSVFSVVKCLRDPPAHERALSAPNATG
jgi:hypothetical protein